MQQPKHLIIAKLIIKHLFGEFLPDERLELDGIIASSDEYRKLYEDLTNPAKLRAEVERLRSWDVEADWKRTAAVIFPRESNGIGCIDVKKQWVTLNCPSRFWFRLRRSSGV